MRLHPMILVAVIAVVAAFAAVTPAADAERQRRSKCGDHPDLEWRCVLVSPSELAASLQLLEDNCMSPETIKLVPWLGDGPAQYVAVGKIDPFCITASQ